MVTIPIGELESLRAERARLTAEVARITAELTDQRQKKRRALERCLVLAGVIEAIRECEWPHDVCDGVIRERMERWRDDLKREVRR